MYTPWFTFLECHTTRVGRRPDFVENTHRCVTTGPRPALLFASLQLDQRVCIDARGVTNNCMYCLKDTTKEMKLITYTHMHIYIYIYTCLYIYIYIYMSTHTYVYIYIYIYIYLFIYLLCAFVLLLFICIDTCHPRGAGWPADRPGRQPCQPEKK